jgi:hypothetical protein
VFTQENKQNLPIGGSEFERFQKAQASPLRCLLEELSGCGGWGSIWKTSPNRDRLADCPIAANASNAPHEPSRSSKERTKKGIESAQEIIKGLEFSLSRFEAERLTSDKPVDPLVYE